jgi:hypothetical protein
MFESIKKGLESTCKFMTAKDLYKMGYGDDGSKFTETEIYEVVKGIRMNNYSNDVHNRHITKNEREVAMRILRANNRVEIERDDEVDPPLFIRILNGVSDRLRILDNFKGKL